MNLPPLILDLRVTTSDHRPVHVWLPLFLVWPLVLAFGVVALALTVIADVVLILLGQRYHHYSLLLVRSLGVLFETRGMVVRIDSDSTTVDMTVQ